MSDDLRYLFNDLKYGMVSAQFARTIIGYNDLCAFLSSFASLR